MVHGKKRLVSGNRPTGRLHLGNWLGSVNNWVRLQDEYEGFFFVADWHALTTGYEDTSQFKENRRQMVIDWLAAGLDPNKCTLFIQSDVKEHAELHLLLSMITPLSWLERVPSYKELLRELEGREIATYGFLGYPMLQAADVLIYRPYGVPVGEDQLPHIEFTREVARRFNHIFQSIFPEPQGLVSENPRVPGVDGRRMSKSYGNHIELAAAPETIRERVGQMVTDPARIRKSDPGNPEVCTVYALSEAFRRAEVDQVAEACRGGAVGCVACKKQLAEAIIERLAPLRERRAELEADPGLLNDILAQGAKRARDEARETLELVRRAMRI